MAEKSAVVKGLFKRIARRYDMANHVLSCGMDILWRRSAARQALVGAGGRVLDMCCGSGDMAFAIARHGQGLGLKITGMDFSEEMLEIARTKQRRFKQRGKGGDCQIQWRLGDCTDTRLEGNTFDLVSCAFGVRNMQSHLPGALAEMYRLLRPGGRVCIVEFSLPRFLPIRWVYMCYLRYVLPLLGGLVTGDVAGYRYLSETIRHWAQTVDPVGELERVGFINVSAKSLSCGIVTVYNALKIDY